MNKTYGMQDLMLKFLMFHGKRHFFVYIIYISEITVLK